MWKRKSRGDKTFDIVLIVISIFIMVIVAYPLYFVTVSYTHLDVYKRQIPSSRLILSHKSRMERMLWLQILSLSSKFS